MNKEHRELIINIGSVIRGYIIFPLIFGAILLILTVVLFIVYEPTGLISAAALILYIIGLIVFLWSNNRSLEKGLIKFARQYGGLEGELISDFPMPYVITDPDGRIIAYNKLFGRIYDDKSGNDDICRIFRELNTEDLYFDTETNNISVVYDNREYRLCIKHIKVTKDLIESKIVLMPEHDLTLCVIYMFDETEIVNMVKKSVEEQLVVGYVYVDNYEEVAGRDLDIQKNLKGAMIDKIIGEYFSNVEGVVRKLERDRYFAIFKHKYLMGFQSTKFELLDKIKELDEDQEHTVTVSIGVGVGESFAKADSAASGALELALGRGGDQAVVKEGERVYFYGGKSRQVEKNTRIKARIKALALRDALMGKERVVVMGHKNADIDCVGACVGIYRAAKELGKYAYIIYDEDHNSVGPVINEFLNDPEYSENVFISPEKAESYVNRETVLIIVDVNKPDIFECPELVDNTSTVILIDHHRQTGEKIDNLVLSYVEPSASSASEMVTEILQYITDKPNLKKIEAEALYGGILIDTDHFTRNTSARTFEAAAFLRKTGIDGQAVLNYFREPLDSTKVKALAMGSAEEIAKGFVTAVSPSEKVTNPTVLAAQVADELLKVRDVKASFVFTEVKGKVFISARSSGDTNVQLVMEKLGGGGHLNIAGCQMENTTMDEAKKALTVTVRKMIDDKVII